MTRYRDRSFMPHGNARGLPLPCVYRVVYQFDSIALPIVDGGTAAGSTGALFAGYELIPFSSPCPWV